MAINITIKTNAIDAKHFYDSLARTQLPFAMSRTVNRLAWDIRDEEQSKLDKYFNIRTNWLRKRGAMPVIRSNKNQYPDIHSILGVKDEVAAKTVTGGEKRGLSGDMAVPLSNTSQGVSARSILNAGKETLPKSKWPSNIVKENKKIRRRRGRALKPKPFYMKTKRGRKFVALRSGVSHLPLQFLYTFKSRVDIDKSWPLIKNATTFVDSHYDKYLTQEIERAIKTARR